MSAKVRLGIGFDGEREVKQAISSVNRSLKELSSELEKSREKFKENANSQEAVAEQSKLLERILEAQSTKVAETAKASENAKKREEELKKAVANLNDEYRTAAKRLEEMQNSSDTTEEELAEQETTVKKLADTLQKAERNYSSAQKKTQTWENRLSQARIQSNRAETELHKLNNTVKDSEEKTKKATASWKDFAKGVGAVEGVKMAGNAIKQVASATVNFGKQVVSTGLVFEDSMSNVKALSGATAEEAEQLSKLAREYGASTIYSASEAADALGYMALAGWDVVDMSEGLAPVLNLAASAGMDLAEASDIVTDYLTAFGLESKDAAHFSDVMAYAMSNSNTNVTQLGEAYQHVAATAGSMGFSMEETTSALMTMANAGVKGGEAGTALNTIMTRLATDTNGCAKTLKEFGVEIYDSEGNMKSLSSILNGVAENWDGLTDSQQANLAKQIAGTQQYSRFQTVMQGLSAQAKENGQSFNDYTEALAQCDGTATKLSDTMNDNLRGDLAELNSAWEEFQLVMYDTIQGPMRQIVQSITSDVMPALTALVTGAEDAGKKTKTAIFSVLENIGSIAGNTLGSLFGEEIGTAIESAFSAVSTAAKSAFDVVSKLAQPIGKIIETASGIVTSLLPPIMEIVSQASPFITATVDAVCNLIQPAITLIGAGLKVVSAALQPILDILTPIMQGFSFIGDAIGTAVSWCVDLVTGNQRVTESTKALEEEVSTLTASVDSSTSSWKSFMDSMDSSYSKTSGEADRIQRLWEELDTLTDKNGKVKESDQSRAQYLTGELSSAIGREITMTGNQIENYKDLKTAIEEVVLAKRIANAREYYDNILNEATQRETQLNHDLAEIQKNLATVRKEMEEASGENYDKLLEQEQALVQSENNLQMQLIETAETRKNAKALELAIEKQNWDEVNRLMKQGTSVVETENGKRSLSQKEMLENEKNTIQTLKTLRSEAYKENNKELVDSLDAELEEREKAYNEKVALARKELGLDADTVNKNRETYTEGGRKRREWQKQHYKDLQADATTGEKNINTATSSEAKKTTAGTDRMTTEKNQMTDPNTRGSVNSAAKSAASEANTAAEKEAKTTTAGRTLLSTAVSQLLSSLYLNPFTSAALSAGKAGKTKLNDGASGTSYIGSNMLWGIVSGLNGPERAKVDSSILRVGFQLSQTLNKGTGSASPSKITMKAGRDMLSGIVVGIGQKREETLKSVRASGKELAEAMELPPIAIPPTTSSMVAKYGGGTSLASSATNTDNRMTFNVTINANTQGELNADALANDFVKATQRLMRRGM